MKTYLLRATLLATLLGCTGCSSSIRDFVVGQRNHQGDLALSRGNLEAAKVGYRLALQLSPSDEHARGGLVDVLTKLAEEEYENSDFEGAISSLLQAQDIDPSSVRVSELRREVSQARIKRQLVQTNYPNYSATGKLITKAYEEIPTLNKSVVTSLNKFQYSYDSQNLTEAIKNSYGLQEEVTRLTNRLISYRQQVEAGTAAHGGAAAPTSAGSLLPLP